ncbi:hypothetical protein Pa4123_55960 [Phytohabitans aurantiacus]|uniref:C2H2-type domain-containing protein n=1 Tax=Phytohabitans aurantiacus TaxID=3016789 RepID=A0ABQ5R2Y5_9ACTN|nr:hypothetical protein Pa4123_55960 [Phytohabitans aurantiacus]
MAVVERLAGGLAAQGGFYGGVESLAPLVLSVRLRVAHRVPPNALTARPYRDLCAQCSASYIRTDALTHWHTGVC